MSKLKDEKFLHYWEDSMRKGRNLFSFINGGLLAVILFIITNVAYYLFTKDWIIFMRWNALSSFLVCFLIGFIFFYVPVWNINSFKYNHMTKKGKKKKR